MTEQPRNWTKLRIAALIAVACAIAVAIAIFVLTEQAPETTSAESSFVNDLLISLFGNIPGLYEPQTELWLGIHVRHWAHTAEFGALGLFVTLAILLIRKRRPLATSAAFSLVVCAASSLADQCHKLLVPGRHFDWFDLAMDALGYCTAIVLVVAIAAIARAVSHARERHSGD